MGKKPTKPQTSSGVESRTRSKTEKFTRVPYGKCDVCDEMNEAHDQYHNWVPVSNAQIRLKQAIDSIEAKYT